MTDLTSLLGESLLSALPVAVMALGALGTERVGMLNVGLEGLVALGGFSFAFAVSVVPGPIGVVLACAFAICSGALASAAADAFARKAKADPFVVGLALNLLLPASVMAASWFLFRTKGVVGLASLSGAGASAGRDITLAATVMCLVFLAALEGLSPFALRSRAVGMNPESLILAGVSPERIRSLNYLASGAGAAIAGTLLVSNVGAWVPNLGGGRGWLALVIVYLGGRSVPGCLFAGLSFSVLGTLSNRAQGILAIPPEIMSTLPFVMAFVVVVMEGLASAKRP